MARVTEALMTGQAFSRGHDHYQIDVQFGGQNGWSPNYEEWASTTHYVRKDTIALLIESPKFFDMMPDPPFWHSCLKSLVELQAKSWDGLKSTLTVETVGTAFGGAGEEFDDYVNVKREKSAPVCTVVDLYGRPIQHFLHDWITYGLEDPDTKIPSIVTVTGVVPNDWLADMYSATMLFIEPDPTHLRVSKAWLTTNMYPKTSGPIEGKRDRTASGELLEISIEWTGVTQVGHGVMEFAKTVLDAINAGLPNANPMMRKAFIQSISPMVSGNMAQAYKGQLAKVGDEAVMAS